MHLYGNWNRCHKVRRFAAPLTFKDQKLWSCYRIFPWKYFLLCLINLSMIVPACQSSTAQVHGGTWNCYNSSQTVRAWIRSVEKHFSVSVTDFKTEDLDVSFQADRWSSGHLRAAPPQPPAGGGAGEHRFLPRGVFEPWPKFVKWKHVTRVRVRKRQCGKRQMFPVVTAEAFRYSSCLCTFFYRWPTEIAVDASVTVKRSSWLTKFCVSLFSVWTECEQKAFSV